MGQKELDRAIGDRLKRLRLNAGFTLNQLAARSGVSRGMISRIERGDSSATAVLLGKLCAALDVTLSAVIGLSDNPPERLTAIPPGFIVSRAQKQSGVLALKV